MKRLKHELLPTVAEDRAVHGSVDLPRSIRFPELREVTQRMVMELKRNSKNFNFYHAR